MKKLFNRKKKATVAGITAAEYNCIHEMLDEALENASDRQKTTTTRPSGYMKGLMAAIAIVDTIKPHSMEV